MPLQARSGPSVAASRLCRLCVPRLRTERRGHRQRPAAESDASNKDRTELIAFPGATEPGTGARHFPPYAADRSTPKKSRERNEGFEMKTTEDYYREFPGLVRSSVPLYITSKGLQEPLGKLEQALQDAGPETGHRRMPEIVDREGRQRPRVSFHPDTDKSDLLKELDTRHLRGGSLPAEGKS